MASKSFEDLIVWQRAHEFVLAVYRLTAGFPRDELFGLTSQLRRAAVSVPSNIAEGFKRRGPRNKAHFYNLAQTSLEGLRYYFILCRDLGFEIPFEDLSYRGDQVSRMLDGLVRSMMR